MRKMLLILLAVCAGVLGFGKMHSISQQTRAANAAQVDEMVASARRLEEAQKVAADLRVEVLKKQNQFRLTKRHSNITPELLGLLEGDTTKGHATAWAELREDLGIGWNSSPDSVLVRKQALKELQYNKFFADTSITDTARDLLDLSPDEKSALTSAAQQARAQGMRTAVRSEPSGDIVAQYTIPAPDPDYYQSVSNSFAVNIANAVGPERANLLLPSAWFELRSGMGANEQETMTIRQTQVDGQPDLICEMQRGNNVSTSPVRYANYPSSWFLSLFPGGWQTLADREGFTLPPSFKK